MGLPSVSRKDLGKYISQEFPYMEEEIKNLCMYMREGTELEFFAIFIRAVNENNGERPPFDLYKAYLAGEEPTTRNETGPLPDVSRLADVNYLSPFGSFSHLLAVASVFINYAKAKVPFTVLDYYDPNDWIAEDNESNAVHKRWPNLYRLAKSTRFFIKSGAYIYHPDFFLEDWQLFGCEDLEVRFPITPSLNKVNRIFGVGGEPLLNTVDKDVYFNKTFLDFYLQRCYEMFSMITCPTFCFSGEDLEAGADLFVKGFLTKSSSELLKCPKIRSEVTRIFKESEDHKPLYIALMFYKFLSSLLFLPTNHWDGIPRRYQVHKLTFGDYGSKKALIMINDNEYVVIGKVSDKDNVVDKPINFVNDFQYVRTNALTMINKVLLKSK